MKNLQISFFFQANFVFFVLSETIFHFSRWGKFICGDLCFRKGLFNNTSSCTMLSRDHFVRAKFLLSEMFIFSNFFFLVVCSQFNLLDMGQGSSLLRQLDLNVPMDIETTERIFARYDRDSNGRLTGPEIALFVSDWCRAHQILPSKEMEIKDLVMKNFDADGDGVLTKSELMSMVHSASIIL